MRLVRQRRQCKLILASHHKQTIGSNKLEDDMTMSRIDSPFLSKWIAIILWAAMAVQWLFLADAFKTSSTVLLDDSSAAPVIILVGLPRSGSLAMHEYFDCQGLKSRHYCCHDNPQDPQTSFPCPGSKTCGKCVLQNLKSNSKKAFDECDENNDNRIQVWSDFDVETDKGWFLPQHFALGLLHQQYPNAIWILNTRQRPRDWAMSIYHWHSMTRRFLYSFGLNDGILDEEPKSISKPDQTAHLTAEDVEQDLGRSVARVSSTILHARRERIVAILEQIYANHTRTIQAWGHQFPSHRLMEINVDEDDSVIRSRLDNAFGKHYNTKQKCDWNFQAPDDDWRNFSLPY